MLSAFFCVVYNMGGLNSEHISGGVGGLKTKTGSVGAVSGCAIVVSNRRVFLVSLLLFSMAWIEYVTFRIWLAPEWGAST